MQDRGLCREGRDCPRPCGMFRKGHRPVWRCGRRRGAGTVSGVCFRGGVTPPVRACTPPRRRRDGRLRRFRRFRRGCGRPQRFRSPTDFGRPASRRVVRGENGTVGRQLDFSHVVACLRFVVSPQEWYHAPCFHATPQGLSESFVRNGKRDDGFAAVVPFLRLLRRRVKVRTPCGSVLRRRVSPSRNTRSPVRLRVRRAKAFRCGYTDDCRSGRRRPSPRRSGSSGRTV